MPRHGAHCKPMRGQPIVWVEDHATLILSCLTINSAYDGNTSIAGRQHVIVDFGNIHFGAMPQGTHISMGYHAIASCSGGTVWLDGNASVFAVANMSSTINLNCPLGLTAPLTFTVIVKAQWKSVVDMSGAIISGPGAGSNTTGIQWVAQDSTLFK